MEERMTKLEEKAKKFATERHEGQVRKYTGDRKINTKNLLDGD